MPIPSPTAPEKHCSAHGGAVSLTVLPAKPAIRRSKMGPRRAAVLVGVHLLLATHILLWYFGGKRPTISPIEPSESMYTIDLGQLNAGFVFFSLALISTAFLGRFFCGWGCHIVALQDFCSWLMKKCGVHPKPFRSRLLLWAPLILACYMFFWPTAKRELVKPLAGAHWTQLAPYIGEPPPRPQFKAAFTKADFWETFATWSVAIPFLAVCGFATVYFLGAKGFCTYGCPYGGFFAPLDKIALGRIRVTDACEHCGHCTAVCTSNVRVHEEVRDYGMVMDPGCMKCMDCISVCPNDALYFGFGAPAILTKPRTKEARTHPKQHAHDLSWPQEIAAGLLFLALLLCFRGMFDLVPLLMAMGMAGIATFLAWKLYAMLRGPNVRIQSLQLKLKGRLKPAGVFLGALAITLLAAAAWSGFVRLTFWRGGLLYDRLTAPAALVFASNYTPSPPERATAESALRLMRRADRPSHGGLGWKQSVQHYADAAYLSAVLGDLESAEANIRWAIDRSGPRGPGYEIVAALAKVIGLRNQPIDIPIQAYQQILDRRPQLTDARLMLANLESARGQFDAAADHATRAVADRPDDPSTLSKAAQIMINLGRLDQAVAWLTRYLELDPGNRQNHIALGTVLVHMGQVESALVPLKKAAEMPPPDPELLHGIASLLNDLGRPQEAAEYQQRAITLEQPR